MLNLHRALSAIPDGLRIPLVDEYQSIVKNYLERRWTPSELSGGKFCEIVYTILDGYAKGVFAATPSKPSDFPTACKRLENNAGVPRSFQILIPRMLPPLYEIRNNRGVGHVGGDVDSNPMDANAALSVASWIMGELVRVFHNVTTEEAQKIVNSVTERKIPIVWDNGKIKRVLDTKLSIPDQILLLLGVSSGIVATKDIMEWLDYQNKTYFSRTLRSLHKSRLINLSSDETNAELLPPGAIKVEQIISKRL